MVGAARGKGISIRPLITPTGVVAIDVHCTEDYSSWGEHASVNDQST